MDMLNGSAHPVDKKLISLKVFRQNYRGSKIFKIMDHTYPLVENGKKSTPNTHQKHPYDGEYMVYGEGLYKISF